MKQRHAAAVTHGFFRLLHAAESCISAPRRASSHAHALADVVRGVYFQVRGKFVAQVAIELLLVEQVVQAVKQGANCLHRCDSLIP
jgi:hypothetical protein